MDERRAAAWSVVRKGRGARARPGQHAVSAAEALAAVARDNRRYASLKPAARERQAETLADRVREEEAAEEEEEGVAGVLSAWLEGVPGGAAATGLVCLGLGRVSSSRPARQQLALALRLRERCGLGGPAEAYDPLQSRLDEDVMARLGVAAGRANDEGKRRVDAPTLFFMPHCGRALYSNVVWANWDGLARVLVLGNSFEALAAAGPRAAPADSVAALRAAMPLVEEAPCGLGGRAFNDLSLHRFAAARGALPERPPEYVCDPDGDPELIPAAATDGPGD